MNANGEYLSSKNGVAAIIAGMILVVDDDPWAGELLVRMITKAGYRCRAVDNTAAAMREIQETRPTLVVSDVVMWGLDGFAFCEWIRQMDRNLPVVLITGAYVTAADHEAARRHGANFIFNKGDLFQVLDWLSGTERAVHEFGRMPSA
jgi:CheY-like chemotaxis protein